MKKIKSIITLFLILAMLFLTAIPVFAELTYEYIESNIHSPIVDSYAANYYSDLINHFGYNTSDSCCYVAVSMLMMYYDSFVHTNFVSDNLVVKTTNHTAGRPLKYGSPGNFYEKTQATNYQNNGISYAQFINDYKNQSLHCSLISLGMSAPLSFYSGTSSRSGITANLGISADNMVDLLSEYLFPTRAGVTGYFTAQQVQIRTKFVEDGYSAASIKAEMISKINAGIPVIYFGFKESVSGASIENLDISGKVGHAMIAYDYDSTADDIYVHMGLNAENDQSYLEKTLDNSGYTNYGGIIWLDINSTLLPHSCALNYKDGSTYVCGKCTFYDCDM